jgi:hypothetical protein
MLQRSIISHENLFSGIRREMINRKWVDHLPPYSALTPDTFLSFHAPFTITPTLESPLVTDAIMILLRKAPT